MNFLFVLFGALCDILPAAPYWHNEEGFHAVFGLAPRIAFASFLAFIVGSFVNAYVMSRMKLSSGGKHFSARAILLYEIIVLPLTIRVVRWTKKFEGEDNFDTGMNYSIWRIFNI